jgi:hypothetical protein
MLPRILPDEASAIFLAQLAALALVQLWKTGRRVSQQELGNHPRPAHDGIHLILTALALVVGLVLLIIWVSHPVMLEHFESSGSVIAPVVAFLIFVYVTFVIGIRSSHHASGENSNPWRSGLSLFAAAVLLLAAMALPMFLLPYSQVPHPYQIWLALLIGVAAFVGWQHFVGRPQNGRRSLS